MAGFFRLSLVQRFFQSVREEGLREAFRKTRTFLGMRLRNAAPSALIGGHHGPENRDHLYLNGAWQALARNEGFHVTAAPATLRRRRRIALIGDLNLPQCRKYRVEQLAEFWRARDVELSYSHYQDVPRSVSILQDATHLMEYRTLNTPVMSMYRYEARRLRLPILYDLDDPLFSVSAYETYANMEAVEPELKAHFVSEAPKYLDMMNGADLISVSTPGMVEHARLYTGRPVFLRRNFADSVTLSAGAQARRDAPPKGKVFRLAFASGSRGHEVDFALIRDAVTAYLQASPNHHLLILGHFDQSMLPEALLERVESHPFSTYERYLDALARADAAVMPLTDDLFNRCKSAVRVIDAASVGVPSIVSAVGDLKAMVETGRTGIVVDSDDGWCAAIERVWKDRDAAQSMGAAARAELEQRWSGQEAPHIIAPELIEWVRG